MLLLPNDVTRKENLSILHVAVTWSSAAGGKQNFKLLLMVHFSTAAGFVPRSASAVESEQHGRERVMCGFSGVFFVFECGDIRCIARQQESGRSESG